MGFSTLEVDGYRLCVSVYQSVHGVANLKLTRWPVYLAAYRNDRPERETPLFNHYGVSTDTFGNDPH